jgi:hypothetical protein
MIKFFAYLYLGVLLLKISGALGFTSLSIQAHMGKKLREQQIDVLVRRGFKKSVFGQEDSHNGFATYEKIYASGRLLFFV